MLDKLLYFCLDFKDSTCLVVPAKRLSSLKNAIILPESNKLWFPKESWKINCSYGYLMIGNPRQEVNKQLCSVHLSWQDTFAADTDSGLSMVLQPPEGLCSSEPMVWPPWQWPLLDSNHKAEAFKNKSQELPLLKIASLKGEDNSGKHGRWLHIKLSFFFIKTWQRWPPLMSWVQSWEIQRLWQV